MREPAKLSPEQLQAALVETFGDFQTLGDPELEKALGQAVQFCVEMASADKPGRWLTLLGRSGTGKTMLAKRISRFHKKHLAWMTDHRNKPGEIWRRRGGFVQWGDVIEAMLAREFSILKDIREDWFVVLDEIGAQYSRNAELATSKLFETLNARQGLFTVITANITLEKIHEAMDARIASRLIRDGSAVVNINSTDFNLRS